MYATAALIAALILFVIDLVRTGSLIAAGLACLAVALILSHGLG